MPVLRLIPYTDERLKQPAEPVAPGEQIQDLVRDLCDTILSHPTAIGLAATQVGIMKAVFVLKIGPTPSVVINPTVMWESEQVNSMKEGCLSFPSLGVQVRRPTKIKVCYTDENGQIHDEELEGVQAKVFQHELDHLRGITILDFVTPSEKSTVLAALERRARRAQNL